MFLCRPKYQCWWEMGNTAGRTRPALVGYHPTSVSKKAARTRLVQVLKYVKAPVEPKASASRLTVQCAMDDAARAGTARGYELEYGLWLELALRAINRWYDDT